MERLDVGFIKLPGFTLGVCGRRKFLVQPAVHGMQRLPVVVLSDRAADGLTRWTTFRDMSRSNLGDRR